MNPSNASTSSAKACKTGACATPLGIAIPLLLRILLGLIFMLSGYMKLGGPAFNIGAMNIAPLDPLAFSFSIDKFDLGLSESLTLLLAHVVPWMEFLAGLFLLLGLFTRGAALVVSLLMVGFIAGIASLLMRGLTDVNCPCFGSLGLFCGKRPMGVCHLFRNTGFMAAALVILAMGPGGLALDCLFRRRKA